MCLGPASLQKRKKTASVLLKHVSWGLLGTSLVFQRTREANRTLSRDSVELIARVDPQGSDTRGQHHQLRFL